jgi:type II secretory pathway pseudopilin PulG
MSDEFGSSMLVPAPGAKTAKVCGILAIVFALTCIGFPVAIVLGIVALVQQGKAKRLAKAEPARYLPVPATGLVTGIVGLVLPVVMLPFVGIVGAIAIPAFLGQRDRARELAVQSNLNLARAQAEAALQTIHTKTPGQVPSQDGIIQSLSTDPVLLALKNPVSPNAPAFQRGAAGPLGTVMIYADKEDEGGVTTWSIQFRAVVRRGGQQKTLQAELITHTQEQVQSRTVDGWDVVNPPADPPAAEPAPLK